eukprot:CAMPEP_0174733868 /NCGR_PEP_ID=MMETSP1094-20130205/62161_1 /TAXON_ID=156173 /ORGANISM="Chrysochromulina brevifilum, Strain UTEX LB 985" /LENGTH=49 /DNA_ID=CAMNT_0015936587 /DNA_START=594 /DNA_END=743 /DNA_ORIENTATION=-
MNLGSLRESLDTDVSAVSGALRQAWAGAITVTRAARTQRGVRLDLVALG